ncbi:MAG: manganese efflux pump [Oscillospiraceae bacterium]|nr:manganese efflux pump [Oscillospiraceae bacterium]
MLLGFGLAMDAFSVSVANALTEAGMRKRRMAAVAGVYALFQIAMPLIGWLCVHTFVEHFRSFSRFIPWIALILLLFIGGKMLWESFRKPEEDGGRAASVGPGTLLLQGLATSIDALSVGFTIADYSLPYALVSAAVIGAVTFAVCLAGLIIGKTVGKKLAGKASAVGGIILIAIGIEIFVKGVL